MVYGKKVIVVMPAYNAEKTLKQTVSEIDQNIVDEIILVDDHSSDETSKLALDLGLHVIRHEKNLGYGGNQKTCYRAALNRGADIIIMVHPDYQYTPKLIPSIAYILSSQIFDVVLGSRILGGTALSGGMPLYKYLSNRFLTAFQNLFTGMKLSEYHTGYRGYTREVLETLPLDSNDNDFIFDNQVLVQSHYAGFKVAEVTCPTKYFEEASPINFSRSVKYGLGCMGCTLLYVLAKWGIYTAPWLKFDTSLKWNLVGSRSV